MPGTSNHEGSAFPRGAVDVSDAAQLSSILLGSPYGSTLVWAGSKDKVHFSHPHGGSYARGGLVPGFAGGTHDARRAARHAKPWWSQALDTLKHKAPLPLGKDLAPLLGNLRNIGLTGWDKPLAQHGGDIARDQALETVASGLIDTTKITDMVTANPGLWPDPTQPITKDQIHTILQRQGAVVQGKDALQWLGKQLGDQMAQRRSLISLASHVQEQYRQRRKILNAAKARRDEDQGRHHQHPERDHQPQQSAPPQGQARQAADRGDSQRASPEAERGDETARGPDPAARRGGERDQRHAEPDGQPQHRLGRGSRRRLAAIHVRPVRPDLQRRERHRAASWGSSTRCRGRSAD